jgi:hypothetical protein
VPQQTLTDVERRVIGNLTIPRNLTDLGHELRTDPHFVVARPDGSGSDPDIADRPLADLLGELSKLGWVVKLGEHDDAAKLAAAVERHKTAHTMPDEKAALYAARVSLPTRRWRMRGDLWMLTDEGLEKLREPVAGVASPPLSTEELQGRIFAEWDRTVHDVKLRGSIFDQEGPEAGGVLPDGWDGSLTDRLLEEEFVAWARQVADEHEQRTGERPVLPIAGGSYSDATENLVQDADAGKAAYTITAPTFMALSIVALTDADTGTTLDDATHIPTYTGYARKSVAAADLNASAAGSRTNANAIIFAACTAGTSTVLAAARCTAATLGTIIRRYSIASTTISTTQTPAQFAAGAITDTLD